MRTRFDARGRWLRAGALAAGLGSLPIAGAAAMPTGAPAANEAGAATPAVSIASKRRNVRYGHRLRLGGRVAPAGGDRAVRLEYAPRGRGWRPVARSTARPDGTYRFSVRARRSGAYRAVAGDGAVSPPRWVRVVARIAGRADHHVRDDSRVRVRGRLRPGLPGRPVALELRARGRWRTVDRARTGGRGRFRATWRARRTGRFRLRVRFRGDRANAGASRAVRGRIHVYRPAHASWYGPGLYGNRTACGRTLGAGTLGTAHRWLSCGTRVTFRHGGRSVTVPVIDRGPYVGGREFDLTAATKHRLGFGSTGTVLAAY